MRKLKLTGSTVLLLAFALFAQDAATEQTQGVSPEQMQTALQAQNQSFQQQNQQLQQQIADLSAKLDEIQTAKAAEPAEPVAPVEVKKEEKKYPQIKHGASIGFTPRMEINGGKDSEGKKLEDQTNRRRLILAWNYKLSVAINEKVNLDFSLADPEDGITVAGSGKNLGEALIPVIRNASFTWKPASAFNLSGGLLNVGSNTALDLATLSKELDPTKNFGNVYWQTLAGFNFAFPVTSSFKAYVTAGIANNLYNNFPTIEIPGDNGGEFKAYNDARIIIGADISLAEKKVSLKPAVQILTRGDLPLNAGDTAITDSKKLGDAVTLNSARNPLVSGGIDMGFKIASAFSLNANFGLAVDQQNKKNETVLINFGLEPVLNFGGENGKLFNFRAKYAMFVRNNQADIPEGAKEPESAMVNHIDTRFGINVNEKFSIVPRYRLWAGNNGSWFAFPDSDTKARKSLHRLELGFNTSF